jgi:hypothetical protein
VQDSSLPKKRREVPLGPLPARLEAGKFKTASPGKFGLEQPLLWQDQARYGFAPFFELFLNIRLRLIRGWCGRHPTGPGTGEGDDRRKA